MRELVACLHEEPEAPVPYFAVPFWMVFPFARLMCAIVHLIQDFMGSNAESDMRQGYPPRVTWQVAVDRQIAEMAWRQTGSMRMRKALDGTEPIDLIFVYLEFNHSIYLFLGDLLGFECLKTRRPEQGCRS